MRKLLNSQATNRSLLFLNVFAVLGIFYISSKTEFPDANSYWYMAKGLRHGMFSSWYFLPVYTPETLRTWGYPFFVYLCQWIYDAPVTVKLVQLLMHFGSLLLVLKLIRHFKHEIVYRNIFLLLLLPNLQIAYYAAQVAAETPTIFFIVLFFYVWFTKTDSWKKCILLAIISFVIFQLRPAFLLMPFALVGYKLFFQRTGLKYAFTFLGLFIISLSPFGLWNKKAHGIFKVTPLEGGVGAANLGYWGFILPDGYNPKFYWDASFSKDLTQPSFATDEQRKKNQHAYEQEWKEINEQLKPYITKEDSVRMEVYGEKRYRLWEVMSSGYTAKREQLLKQFLIKDIKNNPGYYIKTRLYTLIRLWFTGINKHEFEKASLTGKLKLLYPFVITFLSIFLGLLVIIFALFKRWVLFKHYWPLLLIIAYYGVMHIPFGIQARYTVPVHIFILMLLSIIFGNKFQQKADNL
jgi:hypothetical protein